MDQAREWRTRTAVCAALLLALAAGGAVAKGNALTLHQVQSQDLPVVALLAASAILLAFRSPVWALPQRLPPVPILVVAGLVVAALLASGAYAIFSNYPLSRDEHMVLFDMAVYDKGRLAAPVAPFWRPYARALVPDFLLNDRMPTGFVSAYLPGNAVLRLAFSKVADPAWWNPVLLVAGGAALFNIARHVFASDTRACWVVLLVYILSAQALVNAMTPFSMTGHMALSLIWLAAFLRGGRAGHGIAIATGFVATGLHQLIFHPFFAAPFLLWRLRRSEWRLILLYAAAYTAIILWWAAYPLLVSSQVASVLGGAKHDDFLRERVLPVLLNRTPGTIGLMTLNLLRFFAWQNLALVPLLVAAAPVARRDGFVGALLAGIISWIMFLAFILPYQGLGWGFRYLSPYLGSCALLAGFGYRALKEQIGLRADGFVIAASIVTAVTAIPWLLWTTRAFTAPYVALDRLIDKQATDFVLVDTAVTAPADDGFADHPFGQVRNLPDLDNRPLRFSANQLDGALLRNLCDRGQVTLVTRADMHRIGFAANVPTASPLFQKLLNQVHRAGCFRSANHSFTKPA